MEKKNVAFLTISLGYGGAERVISRLAPEMSKYYNFYIILFDSTKNAYNCEANILSLGEGEIDNRFLYAIDLVKKGKKLQKIIADKNIDCVVSFLPIPDIVNIMFNKKAKKIINIRVDLNQDLSYGFSSKVKHYVKKKLYKKADAAIVLSEITKMQLVKEYAFTNRIEVIYNPFDIVKIEEEKTKAIEREDEELFRDNTITLMGRLNKQKGFVHFVRSIKHIEDKLINTKVVILGEGEERDNIQNEINRLGLGNVIKLIGKRDNPFRYLNKSCLFVMSSIYEGFPNSLVEAMACGIPVISTDCMTGPREILFDKVDLTRKVDEVEYADYGIIVPAFSDDIVESDKRYLCMAEAIKSILDSKNMQKKYSLSAKQRAKKYTLEESIKGYRTIIDDIL